MLLERYADTDCIFDLRWDDGIRLINKAIEKNQEKRDWNLYCTVYPSMDKKTFIPFNKFRGKKHAPVTAKKELTKEQIIEQAEEIRKLHQGIHEGVAKSPSPES